MSHSDNYSLFKRALNRRQMLGLGAAAGLSAVALRSSSAFANLLQTDSRTGVEADWNPDSIREQAGTLEVDTAAECAKVVPLDYKGKFSYWYVGPNQASTEVSVKMDKDFWEAFKQTYPNIEVEVNNLDYNQMLDKVRTAALGGAAPAVAAMPIMWGVEFAAKGQLQEFGPENVGFTNDDFWPGAIKSVTWQDKLYGVPTNNETMAFIWNAGIFEEAGLDPENPPATWEDVVSYSKQIKDKTGKDGFGLVARVNAGNTPFRFMPALWAYGGGALDEADPSPTYKKIYVNNDGSKAALQTHYDMYVRDQSVPKSALTNTQTENADPYIAGQLAMVISHPSEYGRMVDLANKATGDDKKIADEVVANMRYGLIPSGPVRRGVVFGGSNIHVFSKDATGSDIDLDAARAFIAFRTGPEWSTKLIWDSSNPGHRDGFKTKWMKERLEQIKFLDVTTSMLPYGIPFPVIPESTEIMNIIIPDMLQNALTQKMSVSDACEDAAKKIDDLLNGL